MYYSMSPGGATGWFEPLETYHWTIVANIKRDPFEQAVGFGESKSAGGLGGSLAAPTTAYLYDWNMLPIGQVLWLKELESYRRFPPLQAPESYNLTQIENAMKGEGHGVHHPME
jgi:arylsulfatase